MTLESLVGRETQGSKVKVCTTKKPTELHCKIIKLLLVNTLNRYAENSIAFT